LILAGTAGTGAAVVVPLVVAGFFFCRFFSFILHPFYS